MNKAGHHFTSELFYMTCITTQRSNSLHKNKETVLFLIVLNRLEIHNFIPLEKTSFSSGFLYFAVSQIWNTFSSKMYMPSDFHIFLKSGSAWKRKAIIFTPKCTLQTINSPPCLYNNCTITKHIVKMNGEKDTIFISNCINKILCTQVYEPASIIINCICTKYCTCQDY